MFHRWNKNTIPDTMFFLLQQTSYSSHSSSNLVVLVLKFFFSQQTSCLSTWSMWNDMIPAFSLESYGLPLAALVVQCFLDGRLFSQCEMTILFKSYSWFLCDLADDNTSLFWSNLCWPAAPGEKLSNTTVLYTETVLHFELPCVRIVLYK